MAIFPPADVQNRPKAAKHTGDRQKNSCDFHQFKQPRVVDQHWARENDCWQAQNKRNPKRQDP
jgi:hypothetical protein